MTNNLKHTTEGNTLILERVFDAPRDLVYKCFTDQEIIKEWWIPGPGWTVPVSKMDLKVGGTWHYMMKGPDDGSEWANMESWGIATYKEIDPPRKLVYEDSFSDESGEINQDMPTSSTVIEFNDDGAKTSIRAITTYAKESDLQQVIQMGMVEGVTATYNNLDIVLEKLQQD